MANVTDTRQVEIAVGTQLVILQVPARYQQQAIDDFASAVRLGIDEQLVAKRQTPAVLVLPHDFQVSVVGAAPATEAAAKPAAKPKPTNARKPPRATSKVRSR